MGIKQTELPLSVEQIEDIRGLYSHISGMLELCYQASIAISLREEHEARLKAIDRNYELRDKLTACMVVVGMVLNSFDLRDEDPIKKAARAANALL